MSAINNFNVLPFYTSLSKQNSKKWYSFGNVYPLASPKDKILPFQIVMASIVSTVSSITIHNQKTGATTSSGLTPTIFTPEGSNYSIVYLKLSSISSLQEGRYYLSFSIDGITMYSEIFNVISDLSEYVKLEYWNEDDLYNRDKIQVYFGNDFRFTMYICTDIGKPEYIFEEELTKRLGYKFLESQISNKLYKFTFLAPEYMTDSMRIIRLCDFIKLSQNGEEYNALNFAYDAKWEQQGDLASVECEFETDTIIQKLQSFNRRQQQSFYNALLSNIDEPILFDTEVVAQYYADFQTGGLIQGKLIHELELETELKPGAFIPIDNNDGTPAKKISVTTLNSSSHTHTNKTILDLITQANLDVLAKLSIVDGNLKVDTNLWSTGEVSAYGAGSGSGVGPSGSLGGMVNVGAWADEVPASDRIMVQLAGATHWSSKLLSEIVGLDTVALRAYLVANSYAKQSYVDARVAELVGTAPTTLDTLNELAAALGNDPNFATSMSTLIGTKWTTDNTKIANWDSAYTAMHSHANKTVLDGITGTLVGNWNTAYTNNHTHANKTILDLITQGNIDVLSHFSVVDGRIKVDVDFYSTGEVSAYGAGSGSGGGSGSGIIETVYGSAGLGGSYLDSDFTNTFNAYTINLINTNLTSALGRIGALETSTPNVAWGVATSQYSPITINSVTRNLSVDGHTHSYLPLSGGAMSNTNVVTNFNSDLLDGKHDTYFMRRDASFLQNNVDYNSYVYKIGEGITVHPIHYPNYTGHINQPFNSFGQIINFDNGTLFPFRIAFNYSTQQLYIQGAGYKYADYDYSTGGSGWKALAFEDSNVASATKLANTRTIWGQSFNGEGDVDGTLTVTNIDNTIIKLNSTFNTENNRNWDILTNGNAWGDFDVRVSPSYNTAPSISTVTIKNNGNVGIDTTDPQYKLDVNGNIRSNYMYFKNYNDNGVAGYVGRGSSYNNTIQLQGYAGNSVYVGANNNDVDGITINTSNYVGIGTSSPSYKLDVNGSFRSTESGYINGNLYVGSASVDRTILTRIISSHDSGLLSLNPWGGNVVIGAPNAIEKLYVNGSTKINGYFRVSNDTISAGENEDNGYGFINVCRTASIENASYFSMVRAGTAAFGIGLSTDNAIIIGGAAPDKTINNIHLKLHSGYVTTSKALSSSSRIYTGYDSGINNSISCSNWFRSSGESGWYSDTYGGGIYMTDSTYVKVYGSKSFWVNGNVVATGEVTAYSASDVRLKSDIQPLSNSLCLIEKMNPVSYTWNDTAKSLNPYKGDGRDFGLIAQELETVMPELVHTVYGDYKSVDYVKLIPHLICAIKQLKMEVDNLKS